MPAGKGHHQFPYSISLPSHPRFQEGGQDLLTAGQKGGAGPGLGLKRGPGTPQGPHPNLGQPRGAWPLGLGHTGLLGQGKASELGFEDKAVSQES